MIKTVLTYPGGNVQVKESDIYVIRGAKLNGQRPVLIQIETDEFNVKLEDYVRQARYALHPNKGEVEVVIRIKNYAS